MKGARDRVTRGCRPSGSWQSRGSRRRRFGNGKSDDDRKRTPAPWQFESIRGERRAALGDGIGGRLWRDQQRGAPVPVAARTVRHREGCLGRAKVVASRQAVPTFPFGHGLSYTTFAYSALSVSPASGDGARVTVTVDIANTGPRNGQEVAQLYLEFPEWTGEPPRQLKGFRKLSIAKGASARPPSRSARATLPIGMQPQGLGPWRPESTGSRSAPRHATSG